MAHVITDLCADTKDQSCVEVCPVDCIHPASSLDGDEAYNASSQLYIDPETCIDCGACVPECPAGAIFMEDDLSEEDRKFIQINMAYYEKLRR
ncbi:MAG: ferredoxin family protein [Firmicutes bacterium]|uniref:Ferredoxin n=1 Tax=Sulfobacillus benefaciens TaxID=453960 RepID=A0A2T2X0W1_9FIRM|nr:ferredoxin family protein [Bacillota bacterium]PSR28133.1 MAG: 4Fe-4S ferredoxin [Sulfobacillus benefaciens]HBQ96864.1 4Fe-4S ferredoxin [Sulfobacillus sp.]